MTALTATGASSFATAPGHPLENPTEFGERDVIVYTSEG
jgi:hypothetical protein